MRIARRITTHVFSETAFKIVECMVPIHEMYLDISERTEQLS